MEEKVKILCEEIENKIQKTNDIKRLNDIKQEYMGKTGIITELQSGIKDAVDKKTYGMNVNLVRTTFNENYEIR